MLILALDPATRCGVALGRAGLWPELETVNWGGRDFDEPEDVFARASAWIARQLDGPRRPDVMAIEVPVPKYDSLVVLGLYAIMCGAARQRGISIKRAAVGTWRSYAFGPGGAKLPRQIAKVRAVRLAHELGWKPADDNAAEAGLIWLWCVSVMAPQIAQRHEPLFIPRATIT